MQTGESGAAGAVDSSDHLVEEGSGAPQADKEETPEAAQEAKPETPDAPESAEAAEDDSSDKAKKPRRGGFQKKIDRLAAENAALKAQLESKSSEKSDSAQLEKPDSKDYQTYDDYVEALTDYKAEKAADKKLKDYDKRQNESKDKQDRSAKADAYERQVDEARKIYPDYDEAIAEFDDLPVKQDIIEALVSSPLGAEVTYYFTQHPEELEAINTPQANMTEIARRIGRIEAKIEAGKSTGKAAVKVSKAPPPVVPVKGSASTAKDIADDELPYEEYRRLRGYS